MPVWAPWVLVVVSVVGVVLSIATDPTSCAVDDPSICGPDVPFAWAMAFLVTGLLSLWVWPLSASVLVLAYVGLDLVYDPARPARVAFGVLGLLALAYAAWHLALRRRQQATLADLAGPAHPPHLGGGRSWPRPVGVLVAALCAALLCGASGFWYAHQVAETTRHLARSVVVDSVAGDIEGDDDQVFHLTDPPPGAPKVVSILTAIDDYPKGSHQPVRVDLDDPGWARLVAEPDDHTGWLSLSIGTGILALLLLSYAFGRVLARRRLASLGSLGRPGIGVSVRVIGDGVWISAADGSHVTLATYTTSFGQDELRSRRGVLVGDLRAKGWAAVWTDDAVLLPLSRLSVEGGPEAMTDAAAESLLREYEEDEEGEEDFDDLGTVGEAVATSGVVDTSLFPIVDRPAPWLRVVGAILIVGAVVVGPFAAWNWTEDLWDLLPILLVGGTVMERGARWSAAGLLVTMEGARVDDGFFSRALPFAAVRQVRLDRERVILLSADDAISFEPCRHLEPRTARLGRVREIAEMVRGLVEGSGGAVATATRRMRPGAVAVVLFVVGVAVAGAARHLF